MRNTGMLTLLPYLGLRIVVKVGSTNYMNSVCQPCGVVSTEFTKTWTCNLRIST